MFLFLALGRYDLGRDWFIGNATVAAGTKSPTTSNIYTTTSVFQSGFLAANSSVGVNHGIEQDGQVAVFTVKVTKSNSTTSSTSSSCAFSSSLVYFRDTWLLTPTFDFAAAPPPRPTPTSPARACSSPCPSPSSSSRRRPPLRQHGHFIKLQPPPYYIPPSPFFVVSPTTTTLQYHHTFQPLECSQPPMID